MKKGRVFIFVISAIVVFSLVGGFVGSWVIRSQSSIDPAANEITLGDSSSQARVLIRDPRKVVVNQDIKVQDLVVSSKESSIYFFRKKALDKTEKGIDVSRAYDFSRPDLYGLSLSADGWVLVPVSDGFNSRAIITDYQAVTSNKKIYSIDQAVNYPGGNFVLVHLAGVNNLLVKNLMGASDSQVGQTVLAVNSLGDAWLSYVSSWRPASGVSRSSDELNWKIELMNEVPANFKNSWLFAMNGDLLALINSRGQLEPALNFRTPVYTYLKQGNFIRPYLGVNYWDLSLLVKNEGAGKGNSLNLSGALLLPEGGQAAVVKNSPAQKAGLAANDIIIAVSGVELGGTNDLATVLQGYKPGDEVTLKYWRQGEIKEVDVVLGEKK